MPYMPPTPSGSSVPTGTIVLWSGTVATIPSGWFLCNGQNGTPDLRNRFVVCASGDYVGAAVTSIQGGPAQYGGKNKHRHTFSFSGGGSSGVPVSGSINVASGSGAAAYGSTHVHSLSFSGGGATEYPSEDGESSALPPFFALAYIMKG